MVLTPVEGRWARAVRELPRLDADDAEALLSIVAANRKRRVRARTFGL